MKFFNLAVSAVIGLAATIASAQVPIPMAYDAYPVPGGGVTYFVPQPNGNVCVGDTTCLIGKTPASGAPPVAMTPIDTIDAVRVLFVATAPGTYNVCLTYQGGYTFPNPLPCCICSGGGVPITIPAGGVFPSVWQVTFCLTTTQLGNDMQAVVVGSNSNMFVPAFSNRPGGASPPGSDCPPNGFLFDLNRNCILEPPGEFVTFGPAPAMWNLAAQFVTINCEPIPLSICGNKSDVFSVERVSDIKAVQATSIVSTRVDTKL